MLAVCGFFALLATDALSERHQGWQLVLAFGMHLLPSFIVASIVAMAWRWEWVGCLASAVLAMYHLSNSNLHWTAYAVVDGPLLLLSVLYGLAWFVHRPKTPGGVTGRS